MSHRTLVRSLVVVTFLIVGPACVAAEQAPAAPAKGGDAPVVLRHTFVKGQSSRYSIRVDLDSHYPSPDGTRDFGLSYRASFETVWAVRAVRADGAAEIDLTVERFEFTADAPDVGRIAAGTKQAPPAARKPDAAVQRVLTAATAGPIDVTVTPTGEVTRFEWPAEAEKAFDSEVSRELAGFFGDLFSRRGAGRYLGAAVMPLPDKPVAAGGEWEASAPAHGFDSDDVFRATAVRHAGRPGAVVDCQVSARTGRGDERREWGDGTAVFDLARGRLTSLVRQYALPVPVAGGHSTMTVNVRLVEAPPAKQ